MTPTAPFAFPGKILILFQPTDMIVRINPSLIFVGKNMFRLTASNLGNPHFIGILRTVQLLDKQFVAIRYKFHTWNIVVSRISRNINPGCCSAIHRYITHLYGRIGCSSLRIREMKNLRIQRIHIIDHIEYSSSFSITLPISYVLTIRTPTKTIPASKLFLIHPVECSIDYGFTAIRCQLLNRLRSEIFYINIIF